MFTYILITLIVFLAFILSLFFLRKDRSWWKHFKWFLLLSFLVEGTGYAMYFLFHLKNNYIIFNLFLPVEYIFISWLLSRLCSPYFNCYPVILVGLIITLGVYIYENTRPDFKGYSSNSTIVASVFFSFVCILYFYFFLKQRDYVSITTHPQFWIIVGIFLFYFSSIAVNFFFNLLSEENRKIFRPIRYYISVFLNFILYTSWSYAFICKRHQKIST